MNSKPDGKWFVHARRNASLHHLSFLMVGLFGKAWAPAVDFSLPETIVLGIPGKGGFVYLNKEELHSGGTRLKAIQASVDANEDFVADFDRTTKSLFGALFAACDRIDEADLAASSTEQLAALYKGYIDAMLAGPLITVQVYGIEAMVDPQYRIIRSLEESLSKNGKMEEFDRYKEIFLTNDGETVPFTERKDFYTAASSLDRPELLEVFAGDVSSIDTSLDAFPEAKALIDKHIEKYYWTNTEYLGGGWTKEKWLSLFKSALIDAAKRPREEFADLLAAAKAASEEKEEAIRELALPSETVHAIRALGKFLAERDWTKGYVARSLLSYHKLLAEVAKRIGITFEDVLSYSYLELARYLESGATVGAEEIAIRKEEGYVLDIREGVLALRSGSKSIRETIRLEGMADPVEELSREQEVKGLVASRGRATGRVRVIDNASKIPEFEDGEILVTYMTTIEFTPLFRKAIAVVTDEGGMSCHAAIVSREFKLPCIVGTKVGTRVLETGDMVEVDAENGVVRILESQ